MNRARRWFQAHTFDQAPRPYVAFAATTAKDARSLYRAQNTVWIWLGVAAVISAVSYVLRPHLGPVLVSGSAILDATRAILFAVGGSLIAAGVWSIRRAFEVVGHIFFATGAVLNVAAAFHVPGGVTAVGAQVILLLGLAGASAYRAHYIVRWIGADPHAPPGE